MAADIAQIGNEIWDTVRDRDLEVLATAISSSAHSMISEYMVIGGASLSLVNGRYRRAKTDEGQSFVWRKDRSDVHRAQPSPFQGTGYCTHHAAMQFSRLQCSVVWLRFGSFIIVNTINVSGRCPRPMLPPLSHAPHAAPSLLSALCPCS